LEEQVGFKLRKVPQKNTEHFNEVMSGFDLTPMQFAILAKLDDLGTVSQNQLGRHAAMDPATTFGVVGRLIKRGLIEQGADASDARLTLLALSASGRRLVAEMKARGAQVSERTVAPLTAEEARTFLRLLTKLE
jgi:DNA-binding MarR family transcriptional regulator